MEGAERMIEQWLAAKRRRGEEISANEVDAVRTSVYEVFAMMEQSAMGPASVTPDYATFADELESAVPTDGKVSITEDDARAYARALRAVAGSQYVQPAASAEQWDACPFCGQTDSHRHDCYFILKAIAGSDNDANAETLTRAWNSRAGFPVPPAVPTEEMRLAMQQPTPYFGRHSIDKSCYEVGIWTNEDWREVTSYDKNDKTILATFKGDDEALDHYARLVFAWRYAAMFAAAPKPAAHAAEGEAKMVGVEALCERLNQYPIGTRIGVTAIMKLIDKVACDGDTCTKASDGDAARPLARIEDSDNPMTTVPLLHYQALVRRAALARADDSETALDQVMRERDDYHEWADKLADGIAEHFGVDIGEHSNLNNPWAVALDTLACMPLASNDACDKGMKDSARLDWLDKNMFHREKNQWDARVWGDHTMWVTFAPMGAQGSVRNIIDAASAASKQPGEKA
ncbi:hypothetical protein F6X40_36335 [Paraburkholderia sp. UCT31]|uniref:hypothetical protein n=1 Tax=Paraburkholderia sp. UCT31 TaxID=2615209 RepID=UPI00165640C3|nr:hypothetical protein [Paraburkholderia sp. UCT31]MBC8742010.1 hypothetical protein [Paraburkholderia sp. UCT31]